MSPWIVLTSSSTMIAGVAGVGLLCVLLIVWRLFSKPKIVAISSEEELGTQVFSMDAVPSKLDVVVIGSGLGGLSAAACLARVGKRVLVLDRDAASGGCAQSFVNRGFQFDSGFQYVPGSLADPSAPIGRLFNALLGWGVEWVPPRSDCYDKVVFQDDEEEFAFKEALSTLQRDLETKFPSESASIQSIFELSREVGAAFAGLCVWKMLPRWVRDHFDSIARLFLSPVCDVGLSTTYDMLRQFTEDERLTGVLTSQWFEYGLPPKESSFFVAFFSLLSVCKGAFYPQKGIGSIPKALVSQIERAGGKVLQRAHVQHILVDNLKKTVVGLRLTTVQGEVVHIRCNCIVSGIGALPTYETLLDEESRRALGVGDAIAMLHQDVGPSKVVITMFVGLRGSHSELDLPGHNTRVHCSHNYKEKILVELEGSEGGLMERRSIGRGGSPGESKDGEHTWSFVDANGLVEGNCSHSSSDGESTGACLEEGLLPVDCLTISFPSAKDLNYMARHGNRSTCCVLATVDGKWLEAWSAGESRGGTIDNLKTNLAAALLVKLFELYPLLRRKVEFVDVSVPWKVPWKVSDGDFFAVERGMSYGLASRPQRFLPRIQKFLGPTTAVKGLFLAGQDVLVTGMVGAFLGGVLAAIAVSKLCLLDLLWVVMGWSRRKQIPR
ncbi:hypothetical protein CBR_g5599 [Chara braunii]|uniref:Amine oxidase domain-containing protein n=1 Tax=Chara braunii TaxID=69332 RepID=A0A388JRM2_CHABU|nr:hypothetical protein CBR_g5599 [Chara braunii]|eukprot:GBG60423.1 hypothetical protein CBR_g5599 [Chara braunii]